MPIKKLNRSLTDQVFGIGRYRHSKDGQLYFIHGKTRIKVTEHFSANGKPLRALLEDVIQFSAKQEEPPGLLGKSAGYPPTLVVLWCRKRGLFQPKEG